MLLHLLLGAFAMPETFQVDRVWQGRIEIDQSTCMSGDVTLLLEEPAEDGTVRGNYLYESDRKTGGATYRANYVVEGEWDGDTLTMKQVGLEVVHDSATTTWRSGHFDLTVRGDALYGRWTSFDSPCAGSLDLVEQ